MDLKTELISVLEEIGPSKIWRPVYDRDKTLLAPGKNDIREATREMLSLVGFAGQTVLDVGCNLGNYSFLAADLGAVNVLGVDIDPIAVHGAKLLKEIHEYEQVDFLVGDFTKIQFGETYDIGMLICFFGKQMVLGGIGSYLSSLEEYSKKQMVISAKPYYRISKHLGADPQALLDNYPGEFIRGDYFYLIEYIEYFMKNNWEMKILSPPDEDEGLKRTLLFNRR